MKRISIRLLCLIFCLTLCLGVFIGCADDDDEDNDPVVNIEGKGEDRFTNASFEGESITLCMSSNLSDSYREYPPSKYMTGTEEATSDNILIAVNERNEYIEGKLKLDVNYYYIDATWDKIYETVQNMYTANENVPDAISNQGPPMIQLMMSDIFMNCNTDDYTNYFDFSDGYWYRDAMSVYAFGNDVTSKDTGTYILIGDYFIDYISNIFSMFVNETVLISATDWETEDLYSLIQEGNWTWDVLMSISSTAFEDHQDPAENRNGYLYSSENPVKKNLDPIAKNHMYTMDVDIFTYENGRYYYNNDNIDSKVHAIVDKLLAMTESKGCIATDKIRQIYAKKNSLFGVFYLYDLETDLFSGLKVCPVVMPKFNPDDSYKSIALEAGNIGAVFNSTKKFTEVSAYWQYQAIKSNETRETYYVDGLGLKYETGEDTKAMLDLIYSSIVCEPAYVINRYFYSIGKYECSIVEVLEQSMQADTNMVVSVWAGMREASTAELDKAIVKYNSLQR